MKRITLILIALGFAGCAQQSAPPKQQQVDVDGPVIVRVVSRNSTIVARAGANGTVYSMESSKGEQIIPGMSLNQLQAQHPDIARHVQTMQATSTTNGTAWAGVD